MHSLDKYGFADKKQPFCDRLNNSTDWEKGDEKSCEECEL